MQVDALVLDLEKTQTSFIRCVKPNSAMAPRSLHVPTVLRQLRCLGMLEVVKALQHGQSGRLGEAIAGHHGLHSLHPKA